MCVKLVACHASPGPLDLFRAVQAEERIHHWIEATKLGFGKRVDRHSSDEGDDCTLSFCQHRLDVRPELTVIYARHRVPSAVRGPWQEEGSIRSPRGHCLQQFE